MKERILTNIEPEQVFKYFEDLTFIPRESGNERAVSDYLVSFAQAHGLEYVQDEALNVMIFKPASPGYEEHPGVILQAHMDMVCAKKSWAEIDFDKDPIPFEVDGDLIVARETSLGADDGIGVAFILALMAETELKHPRLEAVFTTEEETGLFGVEKLDYSRLTGEYVISLDAADEGVAVIGCAGGPVLCSKVPIEFVDFEDDDKTAETRTVTDASFNYYKIKIQGLRGGHSGEDIHRGRAHAIKLMGRLLDELKEIRVAESAGPDFLLASFRGGDKSNSISRTAEAVVCIRNGYADTADGDVMTLQLIDTAARAEELFGKYADIFSGEFSEADPDLTLTWEKAAVPEKVLDTVSAEKLLTYIKEAHSGIVRMDRHFPHLVESSVNLGAVRIRPEHAEFWHVVRSSKQEMADEMASGIHDLVDRLGGEYTVPAGSPPWPADHGSTIREAYCRVYFELFGQEPEETVLHAALEPCKMASRAGRKLDMIAFGPDVRNLHAPGEYVTISSCQRLWATLKALLAEL